MMTAVLVLYGGAAAAQWRVVADRAVAGFGHPESVAYDPLAQVLYVSRFGPVFNPTLKDGQGYISRVDLRGRVLTERFLPPAGYKLHKPKGVWTDGKTVWTADIDSVWAFDLAGGQARQLVLPGAVFANDVLVTGGRLYVSGTASGTIYAVEPPNLLSPRPTVEVVMRMSGLAPNGLAVTLRGTLLFGTMPRGELGGIYQMIAPRRAKEVSPGLGGIDGLAYLPDGTILFTDWRSGGLLALSNRGRVITLARGFKGPADFVVIPQGQGYLVVAPDLVKGELRFITLTR